MKFIHHFLQCFIWNERIFCYSALGKQKQKQAYKGKLKNKRRWEDYEGSINDDLESFLNNLKTQKKISRKRRRRSLELLFAKINR